ncbi:hypothetical protein ALI22I_12155 [Saccharothrix sp. ALI-22-I]|uniref:hypothetical protein n=1 Tax=Saccharothrix sp. ALI-22-I TaxID=1933778 RepID=UPI00097C1AA3|nr:hypothetical protein [Saccharothrix sp. ALI-22-I]ONI90554.1 hypothetical protein ALI22I_12155 [Saccharothrix sp. ALI-22-I]
MRKPTWIVLAAALLALTACGTPPEGDKVASVSGGASTSSPVPVAGDGELDEDKMRAFAKCMRENGVDMPDPEFDGKGGVAARAGGAIDQEAMKKAEEACKEFMPSGGEMREPSPEEMDKMREQIKCLRDKGFEVEEPDFDNGAAIGLPFDDSEESRKAMEECGFGTGAVAGG